MKRYFAGLNGIRAIASIAVVVSHTTIALNVFGLKEISDQGLELAGYGVSIFFVLSGFLITWLLLEEKKGGEISLKNFYVRRVLRIFPVYYLYLLVVVITWIIFKIDVEWKTFWLYVFFGANVPFVLSMSMPMLAHYWSLGVEEQFYLFFPVVVKRVKNLKMFCVGLIVVMVGTTLVLHFFYPGTMLENFISVTRFHCMAIGALGAVLYREENKLFFRIINTKPTQWWCWVILFFVALNKFHIASVVDNEIISVVGLFLIVGQIKIENRIINLENMVMNYFGKISYGVYVWHPLIIFLLSKVLYGSNYFVVYGSVLITTIIFASLSYYFYESYFLSLKKRFS